MAMPDDLKFCPRCAGALDVMNHMLIEYDMYARLETLEGKK